MIRKAKIVARFELISENLNSSQNFSEVLKLIPEPLNVFIIGEHRKLADGRIFPNPNKNTRISYENIFETLEIEKCNNFIHNKWKKYVPKLKIIREQFDFTFYLDYEITIYNLNYPAMLFSSEFLFFLGSNSIDLSFYFYND